MVTVGSDISTGSLGNLLKIRYLDGVNDLNTDKIFFYSGLPTAPEKHNGLYFQGALGLNRAQAIQAQPQVGAAYPTPGSASSDLWAAHCGVLTGSYAYDLVAQELSSGNEGAFDSVEAQNYVGWMKSYKKYKERVSLGNGSGILNIHGGIARIPSGGALDTTVSGWQFAVSLFDYPKLERGMRFQIFRVTTALNYSTWRTADKLTHPAQGFFTIRTVARHAAGTVAIVTVEEPVTSGTLPTAAGEFGNASNLDFMVFQGAVLENAHADGGNLGTEFMGLDGLVNGTNSLSTSTAYAEDGSQWLQIAAKTPFANGTFQNVSMTTIPEFQSEIVPLRSLSTAPRLNETVVKNGLNNMNSFGRGESGMLKMCIAHPLQIDEYTRPIQAKETIVISQDSTSPSRVPSIRNSIHQMKGMGEAVIAGGIPMYGHPMCRGDVAYLTTPDAMEKTACGSMQVIDDGLSNDGTTKRVYKTLELGQIISRDRGKSIRIDGLALPSTTVS